MSVRLPFHSVSACGVKQKQEGTKVNERNALLSISFERGAHDHGPHLIHVYCDWEECIEGPESKEMIFSIRTGAAANVKDDTRSR